MKTKTQHIPRYRQRISAFQDIQNRLKAFIEMDDLAFNNIELEAGTALVNDYFQDSLNEQTRRLIDTYKSALITSKSFGYWPWFINQKQQHDAVIYTRLRDIYGLNDSPVQHRRDEYVLELNNWIKQPFTHELLRNFLMQTKIPV